MIYYQLFLIYIFYYKVEQTLKFVSFFARENKILKLRVFGLYFKLIFLIVTIDLQKSLPNWLAAFFLINA